MNHSFVDYEVLPNEITKEQKVIIGIIWFVTQTFGNGLLFGLIQFDRLGLDPLKRRITDQVSLSNVANFQVLYACKTFFFAYLMAKISKNTNVPYL